MPESTDTDKDIFKHAKGTFPWLSTTNYTTWNRNMRRLLRSLMAWSIIGDNEQTPPDAPQGTTAAFRLQHQTKQQGYTQSLRVEDAATAIYNACSSDVRPHIDNRTRHAELHFLITKPSAEGCAKFKHYMAWMKTLGYIIKRFRCDNGRGEYNNKEFLDLQSSNGITYEPAPPYSQHKNGVAERMIRTINTKARSMLLDAALPMRFWAEAIRTSCYLHQRTPTLGLPECKSPYEMLLGKAPNIHHLRRFGCDPRQAPGFAGRHCAG